jgi:hypothetical protein
VPPCQQTVISVALKNKLEIKSSEPVSSKFKTKRYSQVKKSRVKNFSDLPPLLESDFIEMAEERAQISRSRIRIN